MSFPADEWDHYSAQSEQGSGILDYAIPLPPVPDLSTDFDSPISNSPNLGLSPSDGLLDNCVPIYPLEIPFDFRSAPDTGSSTPDQLALGNDDGETDSFCWPQWFNYALDFKNSNGYWPQQARVPELPDQVPREEKPISSSSAALPPTLPDGFRYPKFVVIIDKRSNKRIRIKTTLENVDIKEIPDSYRRESAVFPRSWKPVNGPMDHQDEKAGSWAEEEKDDDDHDDCDADVKTGFVENCEGMLNDNSTVPSATPPKRKQSASRSNDAVEPVERAEQQVKRLRAVTSEGLDSQVALQDDVLIQGLDGLFGVEAALLDGSDTSFAFPNDLMVNECKSSAGAVNTLYRQAAESLSGNTELHRMVGSLKTTRIAVNIEGGSVVTLPIPRRSSQTKRNELLLNELGYRMSWGQSRVFANRRILLQQALTAYRAKVWETMIKAGLDAASIASHFEPRPGRRLLEETKARLRLIEHQEQGSPTTAHRDEHDDQQQRQSRQSSAAQSTPLSESGLTVAPWLPET